MNDTHGDHPGKDDEATAAGPDPATWDSMACWTEAEREYWFLGPRSGGMPGMVRRIRRILDVSQRGLAALLGVSQSVVARWETGRTCPRVRVVERMLGMARLRATVHDEDTGEQVGPMRADCARKHGGSRFPAHTDLRATGWWVPRAERSMTTVAYFTIRDRSRRRRDPSIRYRTGLAKAWERRTWGVPDDHPALHQLAAEAEHLDELREARRLARQRAA
ncbi:HTH-type transcriptional regulator / antitoxin HipB [Nocardioides exalbidus]|uniref:HTH-type transcriptional regulator / antitoxin HipB n=1 Tax=Nocardioides exalbidus TaxID=402596 RepID=A0A1H4XJF5_9ACTN|nr:helix-turn-helix transcriptional regulator [Nocardioides exalbidus]SED05068.1 HTH-type transcriptional regulator / antitoxin HipB [Nocardioides exalbidus]